MWEAPRKDSEGVWAVSATAGMPADRGAAEAGIALARTRGQFDEAFADFLTALDKHRNGHEGPAGGN
jgi:hypothetical protein